MRIYCCGCDDEVEARLTDGGEIYPHSDDLHSLPFWKCDKCKNFVGCHHKTKDRTKPLGCIPTAAIKNARKEIHAVIDPIWQSGKMHRKEIYRRLGKVIGREYHTAEIRSVSEANLVLAAARSICV